VDTGTWVVAERRACLFRVEPAGRADRDAPLLSKANEEETFSRSPIASTFSFEFTTNLTSVFTGPSREGASDDVVHGRLPTGSPDGLDRDVLDDLDKLAKACLEADRAGD
jgi:hypothetical protein